jgi:polysaccharide biosynthesis protein PslH
MRAPFAEDCPMSPERLRILYLLPMPPSPPRFGAQARMHGLMTAVAARHDVTALALADEAFDAEECERAMRAYCRSATVIRNPRGRDGRPKRLLQLRSLASLGSFERLRFSVPALREALERALVRERFDLVNVEFPYLAHLPLRRSPPGAPPPAVAVDCHEIAYDLSRQMARSGGSPFRRVYGAANWRKLRREERAAYRAADGVYACSEADRGRLLADIPSARVAVIPNAADVEFFRPRPSDPPSDGRTVLFFGLLSTFPNIDGVRFFVRDVWPRIAAACPQARFRIIGARAAPEVQALAGPRVEVVGLVEDLRPHLASAAVVVVPLRVGGGTRLKIVEGMAMGKAIVSTSLGAEGIDAMPGRDLLIADDPEGFAARVIGLLGDPARAAALGTAGRRLAVDRYAWSTAGRDLEAFFAELIASREATCARSTAGEHGGRGEQVGRA